MKYGISDITFVKLKHRLTRDFFLGKKVKKKKVGGVSGFEIWCPLIVILLMISIVENNHTLTVCRRKRRTLYFLLFHSKRRL